MAVTNFAKALLPGVKALYATNYSYGWSNWKSIFGAPVNPRDMPQPTVSEFFKHEVFGTPLDTLENLWIARYGYASITADELIEEDRFFDLACYRLDKAGRLDINKIDGHWHMRILT